MKLKIFTVLVVVVVMLMGAGCKSNDTTKGIEFSSITTPSSYSLSNVTNPNYGLKCTATGECVFTKLSDSDKGTYADEHTRDIIQKEITPLILDVNKLKIEQTDFLNQIDKKIDEKSKNLQINFIEIMGIFTAILAFILININIIRSDTDFRIAMLMIISLACVLLIFVVLLHLLFVGGFNIPSGILLVLSIFSLLGITCFSFSNKMQNILKQNN
ncbi:MAG: hypothetical protein WCT11_03210 [Candidatus Magasanikbacteria bacterium]